MIKQFGCAIVWAISFLPVLTSPAYSTTVNALQEGITLEYELTPSEPQEFVNYLFWTIDAKCKVSTEDESNELYAEAILKKGKINGVELKAGQCLKLAVHHGEVFKLNAESGAKVRITNFGEHSVKAKCSA